MVIELHKPPVVVVIIIEVLGMSNDLKLAYQTLTKSIASRIQSFV